MKSAFKIEATDTISTVIGSTAVITGTIHTEGSVRIEGSLEGDLHSGGTVIIAESGRCVGVIVAESVTVSGEVVGAINASQQIHVLPTGKVFGDLAGGQIISENGALVRGKIDLDALTNRRLHAQ
jgi:cytoskeletal protein CcmA (bactofilin family)